MTKLALLHDTGKARYKGRTLPLGVYEYGGRFRADAWGEDGEDRSAIGTYDTPEEAEYQRMLYILGHHWHGLPEDTSKAFGFTYKITEKSTGRMYLGAKQLFYWDGPVRGYKCTDPSDEDWDKSLWRDGEWRQYVSSSKVMQDLIDEKPWNFRFEIIQTHKDKLSLFYSELKEQMSADVLNAVDSDGNYLYMNEQIMGVAYRPTVPKAKLKAARDASAQALRDYYLRPEICEDCGAVIPFGENQCPNVPMFGNGDCNYERTADGKNT